MQYYGKLVDNKLIYAPQNYVYDNGTIVFNFDKNLTLLNELGYKLIEETECPSYDSNYQTLSCKWVEKDNKIVKEWIIESNILKLISRITEDINNWCEYKLDCLISSGKYYIKGSWFSTYSNVYQALKFAEDLMLDIEPSAVIVATTEYGDYININIKSSSELEILYKTAMLRYQEIITKRNELLVRLQNCTTIEDIEQIKNLLN